MRSVHAAPSSVIPAQAGILRRRRHPRSPIGMSQKPRSRGKALALPPSFPPPSSVIPAQAGILRRRRHPRSPIGMSQNRAPAIIPAPFLRRRICSAQCRSTRTLRRRQEQEGEGSKPTKNSYSTPSSSLPFILSLFRESAPPYLHARVRSPTSKTYICRAPSCAESMHTLLPSRLQRG